MNLRTFVDEIKKGNISCEEAIHIAVAKSEALNKKYNFFNTTTFDIARKQAHFIHHAVQNNYEAGKLAGVAISVKDALCIQGIESCAGSAILKGYKPLITATAVERIISAGGCIIGKTTQDEFGFGSFNTNVGKEFPIPSNPNDTSRTCGGSSGGAACITAAADFPHIAIGESTGGSIVNPAAFCGVVGFCPTYGRVSRFGLIDYANSLDKIGPMGKTTDDVALALEIMAGKDEKDHTSSDKPVDNYSIHTPTKKFSIGIIKEAFSEGVDDKITKNIKNAITSLQNQGVEIQEVSLPLTYKYGIPSYYLIAMSEASTNLARYAGLLYGASEPFHKEYREYITRIRTNYFGAEAKRRLLIGTFARMAGWRDAYYTKALQVRQLIIQEYSQVFSKVDALVTPTMPFIAPKFEEIKTMTPLQNYMADILTVGPNIAGLPHITLPCGKVQSMPAGILFTAPHFREDTLIHLGTLHEQSE